VHGDTTTTFVAALAAFFLKIPVGHVEAGLRTRDKYRPFPEEMNRHLAGVLTDYHFAPTPWARDNLLSEGVPPERIWVTGNTVIDALQIVAHRVGQEKTRWEDYFRQEYGLSLDKQRLILVTGHRRENFGPGFENIFRGPAGSSGAFPGRPGGLSGASQPQRAAPGLRNSFPGRHRRQGRRLQDGD